MLQHALGNFYQHLLAYLVKQFMDQKPISEMVHKKTVEFPSVEVKWPDIKEFKTKADAVEVFKLGNTQMNKALKFFVCDGYVTEHYRI